MNFLWMLFAEAEAVELTGAADIRPVESLT